MGRWVAALRWLGAQDWFPPIGKRIFPRLDRLVYRLTGGRMMSVGPVLIPTLLLTTTGHRSGKAGTTPLFFVRDGESIVVAGSNFGLPAHPVWAENLLRNPEATVQIGQQSRRYTARLANETEAARAWPRLVESWPAYERYRERSGRDIRIFVLTPA
jgi:F420H(2)-dependent quinone reductase